ncbi:transcriptional regulator [Natribacillus halophilus]|uniref:Phage transcriptional activator, RinA family n=1 Tax=Natribacillus halophilus TaxID=549003 RepID=A0A1G8RT56_9BACI|nr:transcriptional regulator [Natribacillus halophilus]SDJ20109.1 phage transcriptional activator, RinA family [Natribacillus halophilus]
MQAVKLRKSTFKHVEAEICAYPEYQKEIKSIREEIINGQGEVDENFGAGKNSPREPGRPTEKIATRLVTNRRLRHLEEVTEAIEDVYNRLDDTQKKMVKLRYWNRESLGWEAIAYHCNIGRASAFRYREAIVQSIGERIGWK